MKLVHRVLVAVFALTGVVPSEASAQIFLASKPHPDFAIGPLFLIANVRPDLTVTVNLSFSPRCGREPHTGPWADLFCCAG